MERELKPSVLITQGKYKGWRAFGPYLQRRKGRPEKEYYSLRNTKDGKRKHIYAEEFDTLGLNSKPKDDRPFL